MVFFFSLLGSLLFQFVFVVAVSLPRVSGVFSSVEFISGSLVVVPLDG
jgi:hypothetical protein